VEPVHTVLNFNLLSQDVFGKGTGLLVVLLVGLMLGTVPQVEPKELPPIGLAGARAGNGRVEVQVQGLAAAADLLFSDTVSNCHNFSILVPRGVG
jgi:hypothetical protein